MGEYYENRHDVAVTFYEPGDGDPWAEVRAYSYPDGSMKNSLSPADLRDVAEMLTEAADELEERTDAE